MDQLEIEKVNAGAEMKIAFCLLFTLLIPVSGICADPESADKQLKRLLRRGLSENELFKAVSKLPFSQPELDCAALRLFDNKNETDAIRIAALPMCSMYDSRLSKSYERVLQNKDASEQLLQAVLDHIRPGYSKFAASYPELVPSIRPHLAHRSSKIRVRAMFLLASYKDEASIEQLVKGLDGSGNKIIPDANAIEIVRSCLMRTDASTKKYIELIRPYLHDMSPDARFEALRTIFDAKSRPRVLEIALDQKEDDRVRTQAVKTLRDPDYYLELLNSPKTPIEHVRIALHMSIGYFNYNKRVPKKLPAFKKRMAEIAADDSLPDDIREMAKRMR